MTQPAEVIFEIEETVTLKQGGALVTDYCPSCRETVDMLSPEVLSLVSGVSEREIFRLVEMGTIHFAETGRLVVCPVCYRRSVSNADQLDVRRECVPVTKL